MRRVLRLCIIVGVFAVAGLAGAGIWFYSALERPYHNEQKPDVIVDIHQGMSTTGAADLLVASGVLRSRLPFLLYLRFAHRGRHIQAG